MKLLLLALFFGTASATVFTANVKGTVICHKRKQSGILVEFKEADAVSKDDLMGTATTDTDGFFEISGKNDEWGGIEPYVYIYHNCRTIKEGCLTRSRYEYPQYAVNGVYDMSYIALDIATADESSVKCQ
ncbi:unnamed protein product, partial [Mesorhabditis spiculigera]